MSLTESHHIQEGLVLQEYSELKEYKLQSLQAQMQLEQRSYQDFLRLPRAQSIIFDAPRSTLLKASLPYCISVGHIHVLCGAATGRSQCVWAYVSSDTTPVGIDSIHFCLADDTVISLKSILQVDLKHPFSGFKSSALDDEMACTRLRTLVLYYFLARGFVRRIGLTTMHWFSFTLACATVAKSKVFQVSSYEVEPISGVELLGARKRCIDEANGGSVEQDAGSEIEPGEEHTSKLDPSGKRKSYLLYPGSAKRCKTDDGVRNDISVTQKHHADSTQFAEYQKFVQTIREQTNAENSVLKAENGSLKLDLAHLRTREAELSKEHELFRSNSEEELEKLRAQVDELQAFKMKIQRACGAE